MVDSDIVYFPVGPFMLPIEVMVHASSLFQVVIQMANGLFQVVIQMAVNGGWCEMAVLMYSEGLTIQMCRLLRLQRQTIL